MANNLSLGIVIGASLAGSFNGTFKTLDAKIGQSRKQLASARIGSTLADDVLKYKHKLDALEASQQQFGVGNTRLWGQIAETERSYRKASLAAEKYGLSVGDIISGHARLGASAQQAERKLDRLATKQANKDKRAEIGGQVVGAVGMAYAMAAPVKSAIEFESVMADVRKVVDVSDAEFKALGKSILDMSTKMPMAASGIGAIVAAAGQSGVAKNELLGFTQAAVKMGVAFDMTGEEAGSTMASWRAGMAINQQQAEALADAVNYLDSNMNASAKSISEVVTRQGAVAKAAGLTEIQIAALSAALLNSGAAPEIAATALKNLTNALTAGESATKSQLGAYEELGLSYKQVSLDMQKDAEGTIKKVFTALAKAPAANRGALVGGLFGEEAKGAIMPLLVNMKALDDAFNSVGDSTKYAGSMQKEYDVRAKTAANNMQLLGNQVTRVGVNLGTVLLPTLNSVGGALGSVFDSIAVMSERFPVLTSVVVGAAVGLVGLKVAALAVGYTATLISDGWLIATGVMNFFRLSSLQATGAMVWQKTVAIGAAIQQGALAVSTGVVAAAQWVLNTAIVAGTTSLIGQAAAFVWQKGVMLATVGATTAITASQWLWNAAMTANPIGLVIAGVAAFGALAVTVYKNWEPIMNWFGEKFAWLGKSMEWAKGLGGVFKSEDGSRGSLSGLAGPVKNTAGAAAMAAVLAAPSPAMAATSPHKAGAGTSPMVSQNNTFHITQLPGEDHNALTDRIMDQMARKQNADKRRNLYD